MDNTDWSAGNARYLSASLSWLRARLKMLADVHAPAGATPRRGLLARKPQFAPADDTALLNALQEREAAAQLDPPPALLYLAQAFGLSPFERDTLLLCAAMEFDTRLPALCAAAQGHPELAHPTFALAFSLFESPGWDALTAARPLRHWRLIDARPTSNTQPLTQAPLRADEGVVHFLKGLKTVDSQLAASMPEVSTRAMPLPPSQQAVADAMLARWQATARNGDALVAVLAGTDAGAKLALAQAAARTLGRALHRCSIDSLPTAPAELETLLRAWQRHTALMPLALVLDVDNAQAEHALRVATQLAQGGAPVMVFSRGPLPQSGRAAYLLEVARPTAAEQREAWQAALGDAHAVLAGRLAAHFSLNGDDIAAIAGTVAALPRTGSLTGSLEEALWDACIAHVRPRIDALAERIVPKAGWADLTVTDETGRLLREIVAQAEQRDVVYERWGYGARMNRGRGISALFAGESGTGKTMAAEVIANALRLGLYRIDLSQVVSKYIGETEKNLARAFDALESGGAILFFDEADALFGKRSEVRDSHDRYANIEVNYLLQRMETFSGIAILATNLKSALDSAFARRLRFIVPFQFPAPPERRRIWERAFTPETPQSGLDFERLSRLPLTGANIHSVALNAAFLASADGGTVTMPLILRAARDELRKLDKPISEAELKT